MRKPSNPTGRDRWWVRAGLGIMSLASAKEARLFGKEQMP